MGGRLLRHWLSFPLIDLTEIHRRQSVVTDLVRTADLRRTTTELRHRAIGGPRAYGIEGRRRAYLPS